MCSTIQPGSGILVGVVSQMGVECFLSALVFVSLFTGGQTTNKTSAQSPANPCNKDGLNFSGTLFSRDMCIPGNDKRLDLSRNNFTGIDESFWRNSASLSHLNLSFNDISEELTSGNIGRLNMLEELDLSRNNFSGYLPSAIENLTNLETAKLKGNMFMLNENTRKVCFSDSLVHLDLSNNGYNEQTFPCVKPPSNLTHLDLSNANLNGEISGKVSRLENLQHLDLSRNNFSADLLDVIRSLPNLTFVSLKGNKIKWNTTCFNGSLQHLDLSNNRFGSKAFPCVKNLVNLTHLDLSNARITGEVPKEISQLVNLKYLVLSHNHLIGSIPNLTAMVHLNELDLSSNNLTGEISGNVSRLENLQHLDLSQNNFSADLLDVIRSLPSLTFVSLKGNKIKWNTTCFNGSLQHLDLSNNRFGSKAFPCVKNLVNLTHLDLSNASINGEVPKEISQLINLKYLVLSHNHLIGSIPNLTAMVHLNELDLSSNNLTGNITSQLHDKLIKMSKFNLSGNSHLQVCSSFFQGNQTSIVGLKQINCTTGGGNQNSGGNKSVGSKGKQVSKTVLYAVLVPSIVSVVVLLFLAFAYRKRKHLYTGKPQHKKGEYRNLGPYSFQTESSSWNVDVKLPTSLPIIIIDKPLLNLTFADLLAVTSNFDEKTLSAEERFGPVYRGALPGEVHVDIKILVHNSVLTDQEVATELERLGRIKHSNLVPLIGYCLAGAQRIIIQEHMKNGNLHALLHDSPIGCESGDAWGEDDSDVIGYVTSEGKNTWAFRHRVALGIARGLAFLHHGCSPQIVHGDVRTSSILLDDDFEPRFSDYGLAELIESNLVGENPYGSPGYVIQVTTSSTIHFRTPESDVYAFGVVLFELVTGKKPFDNGCEDVNDADMVSWVRRLVGDNLLSDVIDERIWNSKQEKQMGEALRIGYLCTAEVPSKRPSMQQIVGLLKDIGPKDLN